MMAANPLASLSDPGDGPRVTVYSISGCRHCKAAKALLGERLVGITGADGQPAQFVDVNLETYPVLRPVVAELTGKKTVPQIFFNEKHIGGNDQLQAMKTDGSLDAELASCYGASPTLSAMPPLPDASQAAAATASGPSQEFFTGADAKIETAVMAMEAADGGLPMADVNSCFSSSKKCFTGTQLVAWLEKNGAALEPLSGETEQCCTTFSRGDILQHMVQPLLAAHIIHAARGSSKWGCMPVFGCCCCGCCNCSMCCLKPAGHDVYEPNVESGFVESKVYQLQSHAYTGCLNMTRIFSGNARPGVEVSGALRSLILKIYNDFLSSDGRAVDYHGIAGSDSFRQYVIATSELQAVDIGAMTRQEKLAFFINTYNALVIHSTVENGFVPNNKFFRYLSVYNIGGYKYSLNEMENGIMRGNQPPPYSKLRHFDEHDPRIDFIVPGGEPKIHFALVCGARSCPPIKLYDASNIDEAMTVAAEAFLEDDVEIDMATSTVTVTQILNWYRADFGSSEKGILEWICPYLPAEKKGQVTQLLQSGKFKVKHREYDWTQNGEK